MTATALGARALVWDPVLGTCLVPCEVLRKVPLRPWKRDQYEVRLADGTLLTLTEDQILRDPIMRGQS